MTRRVCFRNDNEKCVEALIEEISTQACVGSLGEVVVVVVCVGWGGGGDVELCAHLCILLAS